MSDDNSEPASDAPDATCTSHPADVTDCHDNNRCHDNHVNDDEEDEDVDINAVMASVAKGERCPGDGRSFDEEGGHLVEEDSCYGDGDHSDGGSDHVFLTSPHKPCENMLVFSDFF